jgi:hypothetical protein
VTSNRGGRRYLSQSAGRKTHSPVNEQNRYALYAMRLSAIQKFGVISYFKKYLKIIISQRRKDAKKKNIYNIPIPYYNEVNSGKITK